MVSCQFVLTAWLFQSWVGKTHGQTHRLDEMLIVWNLSLLKKNNLIKKKGHHMLALMLDPIFKGMCLINNYVVMKMKTIKNLAKMQTIKVYSRS
jgi:hypothetical protein